MAEIDTAKVDIALAKINKDYGAGSILRLGDDSIKPVPVVPTGALSLDIALGVGGLPRGAFIEIFGPESSGKSTLATSIVAEAQQQGLLCAYLDTEHALDPLYASALGVDMNNLIFSQPDYGEQAFDILETLIKTESFGVIVIDSVAMLTPKAELEGDMEQAHMGLQSRMMSKGTRKITGLAKENQCMIVFINQIREKIGVMFGNPETTPGGRALKFAASVRLRLQKKEDIKRNGEFIGIKVKANVIKNKVAPPMKVTEFDILYGRGINTLGCIFDMALDQGIFTQAGAWVKYEGESFAQGRDNAIIKLAEDMEFTNDIEKRIRINAGLLKEDEPVATQIVEQDA